MQASRAPWWFYLLTVSFLAGFPLMLYNAVWGPMDDCITPAAVGGYVIAKEVQPDKSAGCAGVQVGDRILVVDGVRVRGVFDYYRSQWNYESGLPIAMEVERDGKSIDLAMTFPPGSLGVLRWIDWEMIAIATFTFGLALIIGVRRPRESVARIAA